MRQDAHIEVRLDEGIVRLTQAYVAEICQTTIPIISIAVRNIFNCFGMYPGFNS